MRHDFKLPDVGEGIAEAEIVEYLVKVGDEVKADQPVIRIETDKAVVELPAPVSGKVAEEPFEPGDTVHVGDVILVIETTEEAAKKAEKEAKPSEDKPEEKPKEKEKEQEKEKEPEKAEEREGAKAPTQVMATPHTRKLARELKVDITTVKGTGPHGRITDDDVKKAAEAPEKTKTKPSEEKAPTPAAEPPAPQIDYDKYGPTKREPLKGVRKRTAEVMVRSASTIPHVTHFDEADVTELLQVVERERSLAEKRGIKLTILAFIAKATATALKIYPVLNSSLDDENSELVFKDYYNIGFATDTEAGLLVPVVRDVDKKSVLQIAEALNNLSKRARERTIGLEEIRGGTFTITNVGSIGGKWATPLIVHPQVAILCPLRAKPQPVAVGGEVAVRTILPLTLSFDHRVLDGADAARFMNFIIGLLEDPMRMLVDIS
jgi:pyruvate dehydrogenase E2 component (dihydrolipoamide acetyltransferase)